MKIKQKIAHKIPSQLASEMRSLSLRGDGSLSSALTTCRASKERTAIVFYLLDKDKLIGWALIHRNESPYFYYGMYVRATERRKGYGTKLFKRVLRYIRKNNKVIRVCADAVDGSRAFFNTLQKRKRYTTTRLM